MGNAKCFFFLPLLAYVMLQFAENVGNLHCTEGLLLKNICYHYFFQYREDSGVLFSESYVVASMYCSLPTKDFLKGKFARGV